MLADAATDAPKPGPLKGKPALRARLRDSQEYLDAMRKLVPIEVGCPVEVWAGTRDDAALRSLADAHGLRGSSVRLLAALDSVPAS